MALWTVLIFQQLLSFVSATTCPRGYTVSGSSQTCYQWHSTPKQWGDARSVCLANDGDLISLDTWAKFHDFRSMAMTKRSRAWVGGRDISSQNWKWVNGRTISSGFWAVDEPNDSGEDCVELYADKNYYLNDDECYQQKAFICEIQACKPIDHCLALGCSSRMPSSSHCSQCVSNKYFYKTTMQDTKCERMCAWNNHYCWPGSCSDELVRNCVCSHGFSAIHTSAETSCQPTQTPSFETCATKALGPNGEIKMSKTVGPTTECKYQKEFYGRFQPRQLHYRLLAQFRIETSGFPTKPSFIESYNFGVSDVTLETVLRGIKAPKRILQTFPILTDTVQSSNVKETFTDERNITLTNIALQNGDRYNVTYSNEFNSFDSHFISPECDERTIRAEQIALHFPITGGTPNKEKRRTMQRWGNVVRLETNIGWNSSIKFVSENAFSAFNHLCLKYTAKGGGFLISIDTSQSSLPRSPPKPYRKTSTTRTLCYRYDDSKPEHCSDKGMCSSKPMQLQTRISTTPNIRVTWNDWTDPIPPGGQAEHASSIESYQITVNEVSGQKAPIKVDTTTNIFTKKVNTSVNQVILNITADKPRLYCVTLEVKDVADNVRQARRFFLYDNSSFITSRSDMPFYVSSASAGTNYTWQTHHRDTCMNWKNHFFNQFYLDNPLLSRIEPDPFGFVTGVYEQMTGPLPVSGTPNVFGITQFKFSYALENATFSTEETVPNFEKQQLCKSLPLKDGDTYRLKIEAIDIANHTLAEERIVHIDRSVPHIENIELVKDGYKKLFVHDQKDLSKMRLQFEAFDPHSGIETVEWFFGVADYSDSLDSGAIGVKNIDSKNCSVDMQCYCPKVGSQCESLLYTVNLNGLVNKTRHIGNHNRNYYFTIKVTNKAKLVNIEHMDVLVDDSPPEPGVVLEGPSGYPDIDFTSDKTFLVHWNGFIDHESGIKLYRVGLAERCLTTEELYHRNTSLSDVLFDEITSPENTLKLPANFTGKRYVTVVALNNAMDPSKPICSDGISRDTSAPQLSNITIVNAKWSESLYCDDNTTWLLRSDIVKVPLRKTLECKRTCKQSMDIPFLNSIPSLRVSADQNDTFALLQNNSIQKDDSNAESDFLCSNIKAYDTNIIYLPNDHLVLSWDVEDSISQIRDFFVGFGKTASEANSPSLANYKSTGNKKTFKIHHAGVGTDDEFFIFLKAINKAGLITVIPIGPTLIDMTPPRYTSVPGVQIDGDNIVVGWNNDTFLDDEQTEMISQIFFQIAHDDKFVTPLLEWRQDSSVTCANFGGGCFRYPISKLQRKDTDLGLNFYVMLNIYNNAGYSITVKTPEFMIPSTYPPGKAQVMDLDPENVNDANISGIRYTDVNVHLLPYKICAAWWGFKHHENVTLEFGVGSSKGTDDLYSFSAINDSKYHCVTSQQLPINKQLYVSIRASCSGGVTISSSDGVIIFNKASVLKDLKVKGGLACTEFKPLCQRNGTVTEGNGRLSVGRNYMLEIVSTNNSDILGNFQQLDVHIKQINIDGNQTQISFQPIAEDIVLQSLFNTSQGYMYSTALFDCHENPSAILEGETLTAHWNRYSQELAYEAAVIQHVCSNSSDLACTKYLTPFESTVDNAVNFSLMHVKPGEIYYIGVRPCLNTRCLDTVLSTGIGVEPKHIELTILEATALTVDPNCVNITVAFDLLRDINISFYQWSLAMKIGNAQSMSTIGQWRMILLDGSDGLTSKVNTCVQLPVHPNKDMYACLRAFTLIGQKVQKCIKLQRLSDKNVIGTTVYDFDARSESWHKIKLAMHSLYLGDTLNQLHNEELDFGTKDTEVVGVILYANERNITWFLSIANSGMTTCHNDPNCAVSRATSDGYVTFPKKLIQYNTMYYICAYSNVSHVVRETFTEILPLIQACSNGFVIDSVPPTTGRVYVENVHGFINDLRHITVSWDGFRDNIDVSALGYEHGINSYDIEIGSSRHSHEIKRIANIHDRTVEVINDLKVSTGSSVFVSVTAKDHAGLSTRVSSEELVVDTTPPIAGRLSSDMLMNSEWISGEVLTLQLVDFSDGESGLDYFLVHVGSAPYKTNIMRETLFSGEIIELNLRSLPILDGYVYFVGAKAVNRAGISSNYTFINFGVDRTPPTGGHVMDGLKSNIKDVDFQIDVNHLAAHWKGFEDPHSGIAYYTVGAGTDTFQYDVEPRINVGLRTETMWNSSFTPGEKYFITVEACNRAGLCHTMSSDGIVLDDSPPIAGLVRVGSNTYHQSFIPRNSTVQFFWTGFEDPQSRMDHFESCIGTSPETCDITPKFNCFLESSHIKVGLNLPENTNLYVTVTGFNKNGQNASTSSQPFIIDSTAPNTLLKPSFYTNYTRFEATTAQWDKSVLRLIWKFEDSQSPIVRHIVSLRTHHEGHTPVEHIELGQETKLTINLDEKHWLQNGDTYKAIVTACNAAGLCSSSESDDLLIDSTPPHLGGFKPAMTWQNFPNGTNKVVSVVNLTWYGFHDQESGIRKYYIGIGRTYTENELTNGLVEIDAVANNVDMNASFSVNDGLLPDEKIVASIVAENNAGLKSRIGRVTLLALASSSSGKSTANGRLELEKHSCDIHFCNKDCTCAVVGQVCTDVKTNITCNQLSVSLDHQQNISVRVYGGMSNEPQNITASSSCLAGHWIVDEGEHLIKRFEWTLGIKDMPYGDGIFDLINERPWMDVGKFQNGVHCLSENRTFEHRIEYVLYVKAWFALDHYIIFESPPIMVDASPPAIKRGRFVIDSDATCKSDYDFIDWTDNMVACWDNVFNEGQGRIIYFTVGLGTRPGYDDIVSQTNVMHNVTFAALRLRLHPGHKYYFTVTAYNNVGLHTTVSSDGFVVDQHPPIAGVVYNTGKYRNYGMQSRTDRLELSWQGFQDHDSGIFTYLVAVFEDSDNATAVVNFTNVGIQTSVKLTKLNLQHGKLYYGAIKALDAAGHESITVYSKSRLIDTSPPKAYRCRDKTWMYDAEFNTSDSRAVTIPSTVETSSVYIITGSVRQPIRPVTVRTTVGQTFSKIVPLEKMHNGNMDFKTSITPKSNENVTISVDVESTDTVAGTVTLYQCKVLPVDDNTDALHISQISPTTFRARLDVQDLESGIKRLNFGVGTTATGFQLKSPYHIDPSTDEIFTLSATHGTPVYGTAVVENFAGLTSVFRSRKILVDHTPPVFGNISTNLIMINTTDTNETNVQLGVEWSVNDDESGISLCYVSVGSKPEREDFQKPSFAINGNRFVTQELFVTHGTILFATVKCINHVEYSSTKTSNPIIVAFHEPDSEDAELKFIPQSEFGTTDKSTTDSEKVNVQSNKTHVEFSWNGFSDQSGITFYEYRLTSDNGKLTDWVNVGKKTFASADFAGLDNGKNCTVEVRAVNAGNYRSRAISRSILIQSRGPQLSGHSAEVTYNTQTARVDWSDVFDDNPEIPTTYDLIIGSQDGYGDIVEELGMTSFSHSFRVPKASIITEDIQELFITITAVYATGMKSEYKTSYKLA